MVFDNGEIRLLIEKWQNSDDDGDLQALRGVLDAYIYSFPRLAYGSSLGGDFYLYMHPRLGKVLASYPLESPYTFKTWFNQVLIHRYADFSKTLAPAQCPSPLEEEDYAAPAAEVSAPPGLSPEESLVAAFIHEPQRLTAADLLALSLFGGQSLARVLGCYTEMLALRESLSQIARREEALLDGLSLRAEIFRSHGAKAQCSKAKGLALRAARLENRRARILNQRGLREKQVAALAAQLFDSPEKARRIFAKIRQKIRDGF